MNEKEFCYWLKGFFELTEAKELTCEQVEMINHHLSLVFNKVTPELSVSLSDLESISPRKSRLLC